MGTRVARLDPGTGTPTGPPWVLLRGLVREHRHWGDFAQQLAARLGARVYCPDFPGNGNRCRDLSPLSLRRALESMRDELQLTAPFNLLGLSMGGMLAALWAQQHPQEVRALVLINSSFGDLSPPWQRIRPPALLRLLGALLLPLERREGAIYDLTCNRTDRRPVTLDAWIRYARDCPVSHANFMRQLLASAACRAGGRRPSPPTLVLASDRDRLVNPACSTTLAERWNAHLRFHPGAGHDLPQDDPEWVLDRLEEWVGTGT